MAKLLIALLLLFVCVDGTHAKESKLAFWDKQHKGADYHNQVPTKDWWLAAKAAGINVVRLFPNNWATKQRDFLLGNADHYDKLDEQDLQQLKAVLDEAQAAGIKVVITTVSLPGARWRQQNGDKDDLRLWRDFQYHTQAAAFWRDLAARLKDHPAVVGYNILNEPHPERTTHFDDFWWEDFPTWYAKVEHTPADLNLFYTKVVAAIRQVDRATPIVLDSGLYATPWAFKYLKPQRDKKILYSFHMAEPYAYTTRRINNGRYSYPGVVVVHGEGDRRIEINWNAEELERFLNPIALWQQQYHVPAARIFIGEFGCSRTVPGAATYLSDLINIFNRHGWHWAFYQFRSDGAWTDRDYEYGPKPPGAAYWDAIGRGERPQLPRVTNPLWDMLQKALQQ
jgi:endoglucanase